MSIPTIKIVVAGDLATGKTSLVNFYIRSFFAEDFDPYIEDTYFKQVLIDNAVHNIEIVDTVDNEFRNNTERRLLYQECDAIILTYSIDDIESFNNLVVRYANLPVNEEDGARKLTYSNSRIKLFPPILLVGTKLDRDMSRQVLSHSARKFCSDYQLQAFFECSSLSNINVEELFNKAIELGYEHQNSETDLTTIYAMMDDESQLKKSHSADSSLKSRHIRDTPVLKTTSEQFKSISEDKSEGLKATISKTPSKLIISKCPTNISTVPLNKIATNNSAKAHRNVKQQPASQGNSEKSAGKVKKVTTTTQSKSVNNKEHTCCVLM